MVLSDDERSSISSADELDALDDNDDWGNPNIQVRDGFTKPPTSLKRKAIISATLLFFCLLSFVTQTEASVYIQNELGWTKPYCMLYFVHSSMSMIYPIQLFILRIRSFSTPWPIFWSRHLSDLRQTAQIVMHHSPSLSLSQKSATPVPYMIRSTVMITTCMTLGALPWFVAVHLTTASDITAIYNCATFFAYAFSIPLLKEKPNMIKNISVALAVFGILTVAYGDAFLSPKGTTQAEGNEAKSRALGNIIVGAGSMLTGLYDVIYKQYACPPDRTDVESSIVFANCFGASMGVFTFFVLWIPLPVLHFTGLEVFEVPSLQVAFWIWVSALGAAGFTGCFLALISLTSPVFSGVAALLTIFVIALVDWIFKGEILSHATLYGCALITAAFLLLSWATLKEEYNSQYESLEMRSYD